MGKRFLVALDTDHIKHYVFATDKLKEIRGASSILDKFNRDSMEQVAREEDSGSEKVFANGGVGLFVLDAEKAEQFGQHIQKMYGEQTAGGASITYAVQELPESALKNDTGLLEANIKDTLHMLRYLMHKEKARPSDIKTLPSHPFMRPCDSCGIEHAVDKDETGSRAPDERDAVYCSVCLGKRAEDQKVKNSIRTHKSKRTGAASIGAVSPLWKKVLHILSESDYTIPDGTDRPNDFNDFRNFGGNKDYIGLIYADGNAMGSKIDELESLQELKDFADTVDDAVYQAVCDAIKAHLPVWEGVNQQTGKKEALFPFDLLLLGGDDLVMVTPASVALDVALTAARNFHLHTNNKHTLSVGVVLAPVKYPFGLLQDLANTTLKFAKKAAAKKPPVTDYGNTLINFMTVTGSNSLDFAKVYDPLHQKHGQVDGRNAQFYGTLRPYTVEDLTRLLSIIREGQQKGLGHSKLHQVREAVLRMNLTTSVSEGLAVLSNWHKNQREFVVEQFYKWGSRTQERYHDTEKPETLFPRVTFPWYADGPDTYRTFLLDFVELYDFVAQKEGADA